MGSGWDVHTEALIRLPRANGGCGVPSTRERAHTAFLSTVLRCPPCITDSPEAWKHAGVLEACSRSIDWIQAQGIWLDSWAMPRTKQPRTDDRLDAQALPAIPLPGRQPVWRASIAETQAEVIAQQIPHLESRTGPEGGVLLGANGGDMQVDLTDTEFRNYLRMRLGLQVCIGQKCQHRAMSDQTRSCTQTSDPMGHHALLCKLGGGLTSTHNSICTIIMKATRSAGFTSLKEQVIPELVSKKRKEPRVDVDAWGLVAEPRILLDVTVTCPFAQRYDDKSAVECGEVRKDREYPSRAGLSVTGVAVDVYGKHGLAMQELLTKLADLARQHETDQGLQPRRWLHRWRVRIATEIARGCSRQFCTANYAAAPVRATQPTGKPASRQQPTATTTTGSPGENSLPGVACQEGAVVQPAALLPACNPPTTTTLYSAEGMA